MTVNIFRVCQTSFTNEHLWCVHMNSTHTNMFPHIQYICKSRNMSSPSKDCTIYNDSIRRQFIILTSRKNPKNAFPSYKWIPSTFIPASSPNQPLKWRVISSPWLSMVNLKQVLMRSLMIVIMTLMTTIMMNPVWKILSKDVAWRSHIHV